jgi:hypothetical protein
MNYIKLSTLFYPATLHTIRQEHPTMSIPADPDDALLEELGYAKVLPSLRPEGDVVTEVAPILQEEEGIYIQSFEARSFTVQELAGRANTVREQKFFEGMEWEFVEGIDYVQTRPQDMINLLALKSRAQDRVAESDATVFHFRSQNNVTHVLTPSQAIDMCNAVFDHCEAIMVESWVVKDAAENV